MSDNLVNNVEIGCLVSVMWRGLVLLCYVIVFQNEGKSPFWAFKPLKFGAMTEGKQLLFSVKEKSKSNFPLFSKLFPLMSAVVVLSCTFMCGGSVTQVFQMAAGLKKKV